MALSYNGTNIPSSGNVIFNGTYCSTVTHNNTFSSGNKFTINSANGNYYLMLETDAGLHRAVYMLLFK